MGSKKKMKQGIVACPIHGDNETTLECPDCRPYNVGINPNVPITGWFCPVCFNYADIKFADYIFCREHWKEFIAGHGKKTLTEMIQEYKQKNG